MINIKELNWLKKLERQEKVIKTMEINDRNTYKIEIKNKEELVKAIKENEGNVGIIIYKVINNKECVYYQSLLHSFGGYHQKFCNYDKNGNELEYTAVIDGEIVMSFLKEENQKSIYNEICEELEKQNNVEIKETRSKSIKDIIKQLKNYYKNIKRLITTKIFSINSKKDKFEEIIKEECVDIKKMELFNKREIEAILEERSISDIVLLSVLSTNTDFQTLGSQALDYLKMEQILIKPNDIYIVDSLIGVIKSANQYYCDFLEYLEECNGKGIAEEEKRNEFNLYSRNNIFINKKQLDQLLKEGLEYEVIS